jgi:ribosomal protein S12 methylthiotransferase
MRGKHISVPREDLVSRARNLARNGVKELMLIGQELTYYGLDLYKKRELATLLEDLAKVDGIEWIRLHYAYPSKFPLEVLDVIRDQPKICKYLDIPLQHISDPILRSMKRQITRSESEDLIGQIRERIPGVTLRTTMLVGFPGETEEHFNELCEFVQKTRFDRLGTFQYSHEEDTAAYQLPDDVPAEVKELRATQLMGIQENISLEINQAKIGKTFKTLIDRKENGQYIGRTEADSPEVDNEVIIPGNYHLRLGDFAQIQITDVSHFDLIGQPVLTNS